VILAYESETGDSTNVITLNYRIVDPRESTILGTNGDDNIVGREDGSLVSGLDGNDKLTGREASDTLNGGDGADTLRGFGGSDALAGGPGNDTLIGDEGDDTLNGGPGDDTLAGGAGLDTYVYTGGDFGGDTLLDFTGDDQILLDKVSGFDIIGDLDTNLDGLIDGSDQHAEVINGDLQVVFSPGNMITIDNVTSTSAEGWTIA
jgi:Ca2+-binding RTX toxin-like protein